MNAGCFKREFKDILVSVQAVDRSGKVITIPANKILFEYRSNNLPENLIFLSASFKGGKNDKNKIDAEMKKLREIKNNTQPTKIKTSGRTFKNPITQTNKKDWELIRETVPLDTSFGDARISEKHCNFFINDSNASFKDIKKFIDFVTDFVEKKNRNKIRKRNKNIRIMNKKKILVLCGGISKERTISLDTGKQVAKELKKNKYKVIICEPDNNLLKNIRLYKPDIIFNALHGQFGEDGYIQTILETQKVPYTHSGVISSSIAMDKELSKKIFIEKKILTPKYMKINILYSIINVGFMPIFRLIRTKRMTNR